MISSGHVLVPLLGGFLAGISALLTTLWIAGRTNRKASLQAIAQPSSEPRAFVFRHGYLIEHSDNVGFLLPDPIDRVTAWSDLVSCLRHVSQDFGPALRALATHGTAFSVSSALGDDRIVVCGHRNGADLRVTLSPGNAQQTSVRMDCDSLDALTSERTMLIGATETSPGLSWAIDEAGEVVWSNAAYRALVERCAGPDAAQSWPIRALFPEACGPKAGRARRKCQTIDGPEVWYDVVVAPPGPDGLSHAHAISLDAVIKAEDSLRTFIQTLTKSFAALPTGLGIFGQDMRLVLFNPALTDMTGLDGAWLSRHPRLAEVVGALRDRNRLPEPVEYRTWLSQTAKPAAALPPLAHVEGWTRPDGTSHRLTAQAQGDGTTTLLIQNVSGALSDERRSGRDQAMLIEMLDMAEAGVIAFDPAGKRTVANAMAQSLWFEGNTAIPLPSTLASCLTLWAALARPTPLWGEIRTLLLGPLEERAAWDQDLTLIDGRRLDVRVLPQPDGGIALMLRDTRETAGLAPIHFQRPALTA